MKWLAQKHEPQFEHVNGRKSSRWHVASVHGWPMNSIDVSPVNPAAGAFDELDDEAAFVADDGRFSGDAEANADCVWCGDGMRGKI